MNWPTTPTHWSAEIKQLRLRKESERSVAGGLDLKCETALLMLPPQVLCWRPNTPSLAWLFSSTCHVALFPHVNQHWMFLFPRGVFWEILVSGPGNEIRGRDTVECVYLSNKLSSGQHGQEWNAFLDGNPSWEVFSSCVGCTTFLYLCYISLVW